MLGVRKMLVYHHGVGAHVIDILHPKSKMNTNSKLNSILSIQSIQRLLRGLFPDALSTSIAYHHILIRSFLSQTIGL